MTRDEIIRAWKDTEYRESLGEAERAQLGENPAGLLQLTDAEMRAVQGGAWTPTTITIPISVKFCKRTVQVSLKHCQKVSQNLCTAGAVCNFF